MKNLFVIFAVATILFSCGQKKTTKCDTDSTKACCKKDSTCVIADSTSTITDSTSAGHDSTSVVSPKVEK